MQQIILFSNNNNLKQSMVLLHGLFGQLSNWEHVMAYYGVDYDIYVPALPIYEESSHADKLNYLVNHVHNYICERGLKNVIMVGNSLGGHLAILYTHQHAANVSRLVLTGSSGLYENTSLGGFPRRSTRDYIKQRVAYTFYDAAMATEQMVSEVLDVTTNATKCMSMVRIAKSTQRNYVADLLPAISAPTLLVWGENDNITPVHVAIQFKDMLPNARLVMFKHCGHVPMMEQPAQFNKALENFLHLNIKPSYTL